MNDRVAWFDLHSSGVTRVISINRGNLLHDATQQYSSDSILNDKLKVEFEGEDGADLEGLTREFFSEFWANFLKEFGVGASYRHFVLNHAKLPSKDLCEAAGRILLHGFMLTGYLPLALEPCISYHLLTGEMPSQAAIVNGYLKGIGG